MSWEAGNASNWVSASNFYNVQMAHSGSNWPGNNEERL